MEFHKGERVEHNKVFMKFYTMYKSMMQRCYLETNHSYKNYGLKGVTVCDRWKNDLNSFFEDVELIEGYDFEKIMSGELQLDKDIKQKGVDKKVYSLETCTFVSRSENSGNRGNNQEMIFFDLEGNRYESSNRELFCREHGLNSRHLFNVLKKKNKHYKGWQAFYKEDFKESDLLKPQVILGISPDGEEFSFNNIAKFARENGLSAPNISMVLSGRNKTHLGWHFQRIQEGFVIQ